VSLEIIRKPSIKPSPESNSIFVPEDPAPAKAPLPNRGAAASEQEGAAGQPRAAGSTKDLGAAVSKPSPVADQLGEAGSSSDLGAADPLVASVFHIREIPSWAEPFSNYLLSRYLPPNEAEARRLQRRAQAYTLINSELYKHSMLGIYRKCIEPKEGRELLREIHQGECEHHAFSRALVAKAFRHGFYWPTALRDAEQLVKLCKRLSALLQAEAYPSSGPQDHPSHLAVRHLGTRHGGTVQDGARGLDASPGSGGQVH
jgi:hypothetical protein